MWMSVASFVLFTVLATVGQEAGGGGGLAAYNTPVNVEDLNPLTLSWNQVHYLVRKNLLELDDIKRDHEDIFRSLQGCYGLEKCLRGMDIDLATSNNVAAGELLLKLQRERESLEGSHYRLEAELRERQRHLEYQRRHGGGGGGGGAGAATGGSTHSRGSGSYHHSSSTGSHGSGGGGGGGGGHGGGGHGGVGGREWSSSSSSSWSSHSTGGGGGGGDGGGGGRGGGAVGDGGDRRHWGGTKQTSYEYSYSHSSSSGSTGGTTGRNQDHWYQGNSATPYDEYDDYEDGPIRGRGKK